MKRWISNRKSIEKYPNPSELNKTHVSKAWIKEGSKEILKIHRTEWRNIPVYVGGSQSSGKFIGLNANTE